MTTNCLAALIAALIMAESNGNAKAVGDGGRAWGCLQIRAEVIADVNRIYGLNYRKKDAFDVVKARDICRKYLLYWGDSLNSSNAKDYARIWNGGPKGHRKPGTITYWNKVKKHYDKARLEMGNAESKSSDRMKSAYAFNAS